MLHQATRQRDTDGRIIATPDDYAVVRELVADTIAEGVGTTVSATVRQTVEAVRDLATDHGVLARAVADKLGLDKSNAGRRLTRASDGGYVRNLEDKPGKPGRWVIGDPLPGDVVLLPEAADLFADPPAQPATTDNALDLGGCTVAPHPGGYNGNPSPDGQCVDGCGREATPGRPRCDPCQRVLTGYDD
jgi:hypothetical protein